jgi:hypothetical protein
MAALQKTAIGLLSAIAGAGIVVVGFKYSPLTCYGLKARGVA